MFVVISLDLSNFVCISFLSGRKVFGSSIPYSNHGSIIIYIMNIAHAVQTGKQGWLPQEEDILL